MMNKQEFFYILNNSIKIVDKNNSNTIYYCYNKNIERHLKYNNILEHDSKYIFDKDDIVFEQNIKEKTLLCSFQKILKNIYASNDLLVFLIVDKWLSNDKKWSDYKTKVAAKSYWEDIEI